MSFYHRPLKLGLTVEAVSFFPGGSGKDVVVAGSSGKTTMVKRFDNGEGELKCVASKEVASKSACSSMKLCRDSSDGKVYVALALVEESGNNSSSTISLHDFTAEVGGQAPLTVPREGIISSMAFSSDQRVFSAASESGTVSLFDFPTMTCFQDLLVDPCGVNDIRFDRNGQVVIAARSTVMGPQLWDVRLRKEQASVLQMGQDAALFGGDGGGDLPSRLTTVLPHAIRDVVYAGSEDGVVSMWDVRNGTVPVDSVCAHSSHVSALCHHPTRRDAVVSGSIDGTVHAVFLSEEAPTFSFDLECPIAALDALEASSQLLVGSVHGGLDLFNFDDAGM